MSQKKKTAIQFVKNFFETGAFKETSREVELEICSRLPEDKDVVIVEFGMGHGNITREILNRISANSKLYAFEINQEFCDHVGETIKDDRLVIINDGAENLKKHVTEKLDGVIASIPFTFLSDKKGMGIIQDSYDSLKKESWFSQVLLTKFNFKKFESIFDHCEIMKLPNFPSEYIYHCKK